MTDKDREAFEAWVGKSLPLERFPKNALFAGEYRSTLVQVRWVAWQAALESALGKIRADVQAAGLANGGIESAADVVPEILSQTSEKIEAATAAERERCAGEVRNEVELPDEMPDEMFEYMTLGRTEMTEALRAVVRATKLAILERINHADKIRSGE